MYKRYIVFGDLHLGVNGGSQVWLDSSKRFIRTVIDEAVKKDIDTVISLGDFFHERKTTNNRVLNAAAEIADEFEGTGITLKMIVGNHDTYYKNTIFPNTPAAAFKKYESVDVVEEIETIDDAIALCPWDCDFSEVDVPCLMGHFDISGFNLSENFVQAVGKNEATDYKRFDLVLSGHFHTPSIKGNIRYIGSAMPFTFHDVNSSRGYSILTVDDDKFDVEFVEFTGSPAFKIINFGDPVTEAEVTGNVVKVVFVDEVSTNDTEAYMTKLRDLKPLTLQTDYSALKPSDDEDDEGTQRQAGTIQTRREIFEEFIDKRGIPAHLSASVVKEIAARMFS